MRLHGGKWHCHDLLEKPLQMCPPGGHIVAACLCSIFEIHFKVFLTTTGGTPAAFFRGFVPGGCGGGIFERTYSFLAARHLPKNSWKSRCSLLCLACSVLGIRNAGETKYITTDYPSMCESIPSHTTTQKQLTNISMHMKEARNMGQPHQVS